MNVRKKGLLWFVVISFGITWGIVLAIHLLRIPLPGPGEPYPNPLSGPLSLLASFGPAIAAIVVRIWIAREGFKDAGLGLNLRVGWKYYLAAVLYPLVVIPVAVGLAAATGAGRPDLRVFSMPALVPLLATSLVSTLVY